MSPTQVDVIIAQVCKALARAHEKGIVHRDIKPQNIFLCDVGNGEVFVKVLDFGIAKATQGPQAMNATKTGASMGTPYYMSPEQTIGLKNLDHRADVWALGVVAYECLTGQRPFEAETIGGLAVAICSGPFPVPSRAKPSLGPAIDAWFARACARDVGERFASAKELADSLHAAVNSPLSVGLMKTVLASGAPAAEVSAPRLPEERSAPPSTGATAAPFGATTNSPVSAFPGEVVPGVPKRGGATALVAVAIVLLVGGGALFLPESGPRSGASAGDVPPSSAPSAASAAPTPSPSEASLPASPPSVPSAVASVAPAVKSAAPRVVTAAQCFRRNRPFRQAGVQRFSAARAHEAQRFERDRLNELWQRRRHEHVPYSTPSMTNGVASLSQVFSPRLTQSALPLATRHGTLHCPWLL